mgnify:CR=1 FL=1
MISVQNQVTNLVKALVRFALWCYFKRIVLRGFSKKNHAKSVIYLGNHQNALIDALLIATTTRRKTTFLTRSDVFKNPLIGYFLRYIGMLPIYRFRDGVDTLSMNKPIFNRCGEVLHNHEAILIFPEGNHGLKRRVRPLKKGFFKEAEKNGQEFLEQLGEMLDEHLDLEGDGTEEDNKDGKGRPKYSKAEMDQIKDEIKEAMIQASQSAGAGNTPAGIQRLIKQLTEPKMNWRELLRQQIQSTIKSDYTFARPSRKGKL